METIVPPGVETQEQPTKAAVFEHLFPSNKFKDLPPFNPLNVPHLLRRFMWEDQPVDIRHAIRDNIGYVRRFNLPFPDQLSVAAELLNPTIPIAESPSRFMGWIGDLLQEGEQLGGLAIETDFYIPEERVDEYSRTAIDPKRTAEWIIKGFRYSEEATKYYKSFYEPIFIGVIGILGSDGKPKGLVRFMEGPRPKHGKRAENPSFAGKLGAANVEI